MRDPRRHHRHASSSSLSSSALQRTLFLAVPLYILFVHFFVSGTAPNGERSLRSVDNNAHSLQARVDQESPPTKEMDRQDWAEQDHDETTWVERQATPGELMSEELGENEFDDAGLLNGQESLTQGDEKRIKLEKLDTVESSDELLSSSTSEEELEALDEDNTVKDDEEQSELSSEEQIHDKVAVEEDSKSEADDQILFALEDENYSQEQVQHLTIEDEPTDEEEEVKDDGDEIFSSEVNSEEEEQLRNIENVSPTLEEEADDNENDTSESEEKTLNENQSSDEDTLIEVENNNQDMSIIAIQEGEIRVMPDPDPVDQVDIWGAEIEPPRHHYESTE